MGKATDRILWSVLILALGVSIFVFGNPALVNLTNQVLHHDDLKATMQAPSLTSSNIVRMSAVNNDVGVSKHAYILASTNGVSDLWNVDSRQIYFPDEIRQVPIPYNSYVKVIFKLKVDKPVSVMMDTSNHPATGDRWNGNDNDNLDLGKRAFLLDNNSIGNANSTAGSGDLSAGTWHTVEIEYENTASANTQHLALLDDSAIDFINNNSNDVKVQVKDFVFSVDNVKYR